MTAVERDADHTAGRYGVASRSVAVSLSLLGTFSMLLWKHSASADELADIVERLTPSVVGIGAAYPPRAQPGRRASRRLLGTGFVVNGPGGSLIATNSHVVPVDLDVDGKERIVVFSGSGTAAQQRIATVVREDPVHDLALLAYEGASLPAMELADTLPRPGESIAFTGFPIGAVLGLYPTTQTGIVGAITPVAMAAERAGQLSAAQVSRLRNPFTVYQLDAIAYPGNSGSAVYNATTGRVIGVMNSVFVKESREALLQRPSGIAYAIPIEHLKALLVPR
ncbi:MAG: serine protease [Pseudomonadota bacterium]